MRKSKRFIKKFSERFIAYIVVFVAFVNACFFMPMKVQASSSLLLSDFLESVRIVCNGVNIKNTSSDDLVNLNSNTFVAILDTSHPVVSGGNIIENTSSFQFDITVGFYLTSAPSNAFYDGYATINGEFVMYHTLRAWSSSLWPGGSHVWVDSVEAYDFEGNHINSSIWRQAYISSSSGNYDTGVGIYVNLNDILVTNSSPYRFLTYTMHCRAFIGGATNSFTGYMTSTLGGSYAGIWGDVYPGPPDNSIADITQGYDDSTGNQVSSDFESGVNDYDQVEDNLFNTSTGALQGFEFFDFGSFSAVTSGLSFCSSLLTSIYENFGGLNGIGIVISVLFSVLFMAIVIGLFRYYK